MMENKLEIKNMVCDRCISTVNNLFSDLGIVVSDIELGKVTLKEELQKEMYESLEYNLKINGFEILKDQNAIVSNTIKSALISYIYNEKSIYEKSISSYLNAKIGYSYTYLAKAFKNAENQTIERYTIHLKIEKVKELLSYGEQNISEISASMDYSSPQHLARQFKQEVGYAPSEYQKLRNRKKLDTL
jgi:AraC family transcriptional regulator